MIPYCINPEASAIVVLGLCVCIGALRHMQRYFSYICDGTDVQAD